MAKKKFKLPVQQKTEVPDPGLSFSFKYLDLQPQENDFSLHHSEDGYTETLLNRLKDMSGLKVGEFMNSRTLRTHPIKWEKTTRPNGFDGLNEQLQDEQAWQFQLTSNQHGRVHGLLIGDTFFIVWLDPDHRLYE